MKMKMGFLPPQQQLVPGELIFQCGELNGTVADLRKLECLFDH